MIDAYDIPRTVVELALDPKLAQRIHKITVAGTFLAMMFGESMIRLYLRTIGLEGVQPPACWWGG